jgi:hypothetical protein
MNDRLVRMSISHLALTIEIDPLVLLVVTINIITVQPVHTLENDLIVEIDLPRLQKNVPPVETDSITDRIIIINPITQNNARSVTPTRNNRIFVRSNFPYRTPFIKPKSPTTPYNNSSFRNSNITQPLRCHHCNRVGHIRPQCPRLSSLGRNNSN